MYSTCNICDFYLEKQSIMHLLYNCKVVRPIWQWLNAIMKRQKITCEFTLENVIFSMVHDTSSHIANTIVLIFKQFIYRNKCLGNIPTYENLVVEIV